MASSLIDPSTRLRVSSVLRRDKLFAKENMIDGSPETCWNSDQGTPQFVIVQFGRPAIVEEVSLMFQGGFVGKDSEFLGKSQPDEEFRHLSYFYPEDHNAMQVFRVNGKDGISQLKILFASSTDLYGRITIYHLGIKGAFAADT